MRASSRSASRRASIALTLRCVVVKDDDEEEHWKVRWAHIMQTKTNQKKKKTHDTLRQTHAYTKKKKKKARLKKWWNSEGT